MLEKTWRKELSIRRWWECNLICPFGNQYGGFSKYGPLSTPAIYSADTKSTWIRGADVAAHYCTIHSRTSRSGAAGKENGVWTHGEFYSAVKNEENYVVFRKREGLEIIKVVKQAGPGKKNTIRFLLYVDLRFYVDTQNQVYLHVGEDAQGTSYARMTIFLCNANSVLCTMHLSVHLSVCHLPLPSLPPSKHTPPSSPTKRSCGTEPTPGSLLGKH